MWPQQAWPERGLDIRGTYKNGAAITLHLPPIILRTRNAFDVGPIFVECQQPAFLTPLELRVEDFEGKFTDTATNTPVAVVHEKVNVQSFRSGRNFSAWIGLVPKQHSSGGKNRLGSISKQGDRYLRGLFVAGALAVIRYAKIHGTQHRPWLTALLARRPTKVAAIALANKIARMAWAMMAKGERYKEPIALAA